MSKYWIVCVCVLAAVSVDGADVEYFESGTDWTGTCASGNSQSPINIENALSASSSDSSYLPLSINYDQSFSYTILDEGHDYKISGNFGQLTAEDLDLTGNYTYDAAQFHFHAPTEHEIDSQRYLLEMHIVHNLSPSTPGNPLTIAVLSVLFTQGAYNPTLGTFITPGQFSISLSGIFGGRTEIDNYYMYKGSLTTPPCTEAVNWYVYGEVQEASAEQIAFFTNRWQDNPNFAGGNGNNRQLQPLNGRTIIHFQDSTDLQSFLQ